VRHVQTYMHTQQAQDRTTVTVITKYTHAQGTESAEAETDTHAVLYTLHTDPTAWE